MTGRVDGIDLNEYARGDLLPIFSTNDNWRFPVFDPPRKTHPREVGNFDVRGSVSARLAGTIAVIPHAAYFVEWTPSHADKDAAFDLVIGQWGTDAGPDDGRAVSVAFRVLDSGPAFMVQDASLRRIASSALVSRALD